MNAYKKYIIITDPKQVILSDLPFEVGQRVVHFGLVYTVVYGSIPFS